MSTNDPQNTPDAEAPDAGTPGTEFAGPEFAGTGFADAEVVDVETPDPIDAGQANLIAALLEIDRHLRPEGLAVEPSRPRLFALVPTEVLVRTVPDLAEQVPQHRPDALSSVEQDDFEAGQDLLTALAQVAWPPMVAGCALAVDQSFLPAELHDQIPSDPVAAQAFIQDHPRARPASVVLGVMRDGRTHGLARLHDQPDQLLGAPVLVPGLTRVLARTLQ